MPRARGTRSNSQPQRRLDPKREIALHLVTSGPAKGWLHTHGLAAHGKPELEMRKVPLFLGRFASGLLNDLADYLLNDATAPLVAGQSVEWAGSSIRVAAGEPDPAAGYGAEHYLETRLVLVDPPDSECGCEECAKELARYPSFRN